MNLEITPKQFYTVGVWSFLIMGVGNTVNLLAFWSANNFWGKISGIGGVVFNFALVLFFNYLLNLEPSVENVAQSDDIGEIIEQVSGGKK